MSISTVTSEALQLKLRQLLPSQQGFGTDLSASDTIIPIIDLTEAAEGSEVPEFLQRAWDFSTGYNQTVNTSTTMISNTGFWQIDLNCTVRYSTGNTDARIAIADAVTQKQVWKVSNVAGTTSTSNTLIENKFIVFLRAGDSLVANSSSTDIILDVWYRQIADINGTLVQPTGFTPS